jgi:hypothetical protein
MPIFLDEDQVGEAGDQICFPHLLLCMGVVAKMSDGHLIGAHFTTQTTEQGIVAELTQRINAYIANHNVTLQELYCAGDFPEHARYGGQNPKGKAQLLNFHGTLYSFDASTIEPQQGTFVAFTSNGPNHRCAVNYKRNEKVTYTAGNGAMGSKINSFSGNSAPVQTDKVGFTAHKLHSLSYLLQMKKQTV